MIIIDHTKHEVSYCKSKEQCTLHAGNIVNSYKTCRGGAWLDCDQKKKKRKKKVSKPVFWSEIDFNYLTSQNTGTLLCV